MSKEKKPPVVHRVNFTMPEPEKGGIATELARRVSDTFQEKKELGTLRGWLLELAIQDVRKGMAAPSTPAPRAKPRKIEKFSDVEFLPNEDPLEQDPDEEATLFLRSMTPEDRAIAYKVLNEDYGGEYESFIENYKHQPNKHRPR